MPSSDSSSAPADWSDTAEPRTLEFRTAEDLPFAELLTRSFQQVTGFSMLAGTALEGGRTGDLANLLYRELSFALLAHDTSADPAFGYANLAAQRCFGYSWSEIIGLPSRLSAEPAGRAERQRAMESVLQKGFVDDYRGVRIAQSGRRFWIERTTIWNLVGDEGQPYGQAALIRQVRGFE